MSTIQEEIKELRKENQELDHKIEQELAEIEELKEQALEMKIRRITLEELLGRY